MLAEQITSICGDGYVRMTNCDAPLRDTFHVEQEPAGSKTLAGNGMRVMQCDCRILPMLADQIANLCGDGYVSTTICDIPLRDTLYTEQ